MLFFCVLLQVHFSKAVLYQICYVIGMTFSKAFVIHTVVHNVNLGIFKEFMTFHKQL